GGIDILRYPERLDCLLRASIPLKQAITARLRTTALKNILYYDEPKAAQIQLTSVADRNIRAKVKMSLVDFWGKTVDAQEFAANLPSGGRFAKRYTIPKGLRGYFTAIFEIDCGDGKTVWLLPRTFGARKVAGEETKIPRGNWEQQVSRSSICIVPRRKPGFKDPDLCYISVYHWTQMNELYGRLGTGLQMLEVTGHWMVSNPAPAYDRLTYTPGRKMGISFFIRPWRDEKNGISAPKNMKAFGQFVFDVADYFTKKGATHFDTWNEPEYWFKGSRRKLAQTMRETYMNIKRANPKAKVCGPGIMGTGYFAQTLAAVKKLCEEEGLEEHFPFFNMHSIHYSKFPFETAYVRFIRSHRAVMRRFGLPDEMPIWNTENGLPGSRSLNNRRQHDPVIFWYNAAQQMVRQVLVGISENLTHHLVFMGGSMIQQDGVVDDKNWNLSNWEPTQLFASVAVFVDQIEMTKFVKKLDLGPNVWAMEFRRKDGGRTTAIWTFEDTSKSPWQTRVLKVKVPVKSSTVALVDLMGMKTTLKAKDGTVEVEVDANPRYLQDPPRKRR
ncbi:MAG: hypothetical protein QGD94_10475, partial [Planctomycetia bacterium]|nr:hypothetical protein [Planctomycetia bacterium]